MTVRLNVLAVSYLFPNRAQPAYGIFVLNRLKAVKRLCDLRVIAPVQWYPFIRWIRGSLWGGYVPRRESIADIDVFHPRFAVIPRYFKWIDALSFAFVAYLIARGLRRREQFDFDLVDVHWTYPDIVAACWLARLWKKKFVVTVRGHEALYLGENTLRRRLVARYLCKAHAVVTLSAELRDAVIGLGVAPSRAHVILNGVDTDHFRSLDRAACRTRLGVPAHCKMLLSVGRLSEGKGHQDIIAALPGLSQSENVQLYIIGGVNPEDDFELSLRNLVRRLNLSNVHFVDGIGHEALPLWYSAADLFCLATRREGCPNVVLEALACGTPVVVARVGAIPEFVEEGRNGSLVDLRSGAGFCPPLNSALSRSWDRAAIAQDMQRWSWGSCAERVREVYGTVLADVTNQNG